MAKVILTIEDIENNALRFNWSTDESMSDLGVLTPAKQLGLYLSCRIQEALKPNSIEQQNNMVYGELAYGDTSAEEEKPKD